MEEKQGFDVGQDEGLRMAGRQRREVDWPWVSWPKRGGETPLRLGRFCTLEGKLSDCVNCEANLGIFD